MGLWLIGGAPCAQLAYGEGGAGLDLSEGLDGGVMGADVFALKGLKAGVVRSIHCRMSWDARTRLC